MFRNLMAALLFVLLLAGCGMQYKAVRVNADTGYLGSGEMAEVLTSKQVSLSKFDGTIFVSGGQYPIEQMRELGIFKTVLDSDDLQKIVIQNNLQDKIQTLGEPIGLSNLYRLYKPYLWIHFKRLNEGSTHKWQLIVTDPESLNDLFICQTRFNEWTSLNINDEKMLHPLFNALIAWTKTNGT
ncbi:MAG: hypothetical protein KF811_03230 [Dokdonella sp.]|nr:hypothetical protein [Dokdonella sp.]MCB1571518.1 hypothetical protein [Xanthomonadales bacterium]MCB1573620.1 hypothetical protein [Xanthomonadales bacterium]MCB1576508.1 hypothetical protein [Xanthomonadales bacterium]